MEKRERDSSHDSLSLESLTDRWRLACAEKNESLRPQLEALRAETARLFNEATELKDRATYLDEAQRDLFKVSHSPDLSRSSPRSSADVHDDNVARFHVVPVLSCPVLLAISTSDAACAIAARHNSAGVPVRTTRQFILGRSR